MDLWFPNDRIDLKLVEEETNLIEYWYSIKYQRKADKYTYIYIYIRYQ